MIKKIENAFFKRYDFFLDKICLFDKKSKRNSRTLYYTAYSLIFIFITFCIYYIFYNNGKSFIWIADGAAQHSHALAYIGQYYREIIKTLFTTGKLSIPMWTFNAGMGTDILSTFHYYGLTDPINLLTVFVPVKYLETTYMVLIMLRLYLSGVAFSIFANKIIKRGRFSALAASICYVFCGYALYVSVRHPFFINPMIYFPLLLLGIEYIFAGKKPYLFIVFVFISAVSNFYFFYMLSIFSVIYAFVRFFTQHKEKSFKLFIRIFSSCAFNYIVGLLMACFVFIPVIMTVLSSSRMNNSPGYNFFYSTSYYSRLLFIFSSPEQNSNTTFLGFSCFSLISIMLLFLKRKKHTSLKIGLFICFVLLLLPLFGSILNGFSYPTNRWLLCLSFLISVILAFELPILQHLPKKDFFSIVVISAIYFLLMLFIKHLRTEPQFIIFFKYLLALFALIIINLILTEKQKSKMVFRSLSQLAIIAVIVIEIIIHMFYVFSPSEGNYINEFLAKGTYYSEATQKSPAAAIKSLKEKDFYRYEFSQYSISVAKLNTALINNQHSTDYYFSLINPAIIDYTIETANVRNVYEAINCGFDARTMLEALANVKYYAIGKNSKNTAPFGFEKISDSLKKSHYVYENKNSLPIGYTYDSYILRNEYDALTPQKKQQAMMQSAVVDESVANMTTGNLSYTDIDLPYKVSASKGITFSDNKISVKSKSSKLTFTFKNAKNAELYFYIDGLKFTPQNPEISYSKVALKCGSIDRTFVMVTDESQWGLQREQYLVNFGYITKNMETVTLTFPHPCEIDYDKISIVAQPMNNFPEQVSKLKTDVLENIVVSDNKITGDIALEEKKLLVFSVPYSEGWTLKVDGKDYPIEKVNTMYMGAALDKGEHTVELNYFSPNLKIGIAASALGFSIFGLMLILGRIKSRRKFE